jgi:REP element-mobilizing transposase RayT
MASRAKQLEFVIRQHGGRRAGAGRKACGPRRNVAHSARGPHDRHAPVHVTLRAALPASLRAPAVFAVVRTALARASRAAFGIVAFSVQHDHVHLVVEADDATSLSRGIQGLAIRVAKSVNRVLGRRGRVWADRFSCPRPHEPQGRPQRARLRPPESPQAWARSRSASRPVFFRAVVPGMEESGDGGGVGSGRHGADVAGAVGMAAARAARSGRSAARTPRAVASRGRREPAARACHERPAVRRRGVAGDRGAPWRRECGHGRRPVAARLARPPPMVDS